MNKLYIIILIFLLNVQFLIAQNSNRKTSEIQIDVKTESLQKSIRPQELSLEIIKDNQEIPGFLSLEIKNIENVLTLVAAKLNNEDLWLLNSSVSANNEKVVSWNFDKENSRILIYPYSWNSPYILELNIQVNLKNVSSIENTTSTSIILTSELAGGLFEATPTGRGNEVQFR